MKLNSKYFLVLLLCFLVIIKVQYGFTQDIQPKTGSIRGVVVDSETQQPLMAVNILVKNSIRGAATDAEGHFDIPLLPVGGYSLIYRYLGYETMILSDVIVRSKRITNVHAELNPSILRGDTLVVTAGYFPEVSKQPMGVARFSREEIRRAPTIGGDINRIINSLPSLSNENQNNYIIARGGSTVENSFYIDNIRVPNINHFPIPGTTGGAVSLLNIDFIQNIDVVTGGFPAKYGDVLSSVLDIKYREGNRDNVDLQTDLNFTGLSAAVEGPIHNGEGSYLYSYKHSFTDILLALIGSDQEPVIYDELQGKVVYDLSQNHRISVLHLYGKDRWKILRDDAISRSENGYGQFGMTENILGVNWRYLWGKKGFSNTSLSHTYMSNDIRYLKTSDQTERFIFQSDEQELTLRNVTHFIPSDNFNWEFGMEVRRFSGRYDNTVSSFINLVGHIVPEIHSQENMMSWKSGLFAEIKIKPVSWFTMVPGLRIDHFSLNEKATFSPRLALSGHIDKKTTISGAAGITYQNLPPFFLAQNPNFKTLPDMKATHFSLGFNRLFSDDTRLSLELYHKDYRHCPMDPAQGSLFILDENIYSQFYSYHENLLSTGRAKTQGVELFIQKRLSHRFYGLLSGTYYCAQYRDLTGQWRNRITDNRFLVTAEMGYKPNPSWEFSWRWSYAGGMPYTPYDPEASSGAGYGIYDDSKVMSERLPAYSCLNVRIDRRFYFGRSNLIVYLSIWNVLNRDNVSYHYWDEYGNVAGNYTQWPRLPVFGVEFEL